MQDHCVLTPSTRRVQVYVYECVYMHNYGVCLLYTALPPTMVGRGRKCLGTKSGRKTFLTLC